MDRIIGTLGGGQLGMFTAKEAQQMGFRTRVYTSEQDCPAASFADALYTGSFEDRQMIRHFGHAVGNGVITLEFENVPVSALNLLIAQQKIVRPAANVLMVAQNRLLEKDLANDLGIPTTPYADLRALLQKGGCNRRFDELLPGVLKTVRSGYDGKGQVRVKSVAEAEEAWATLHRVDCVLERLVDFDQEVSCIVARNSGGYMLVFPPVYNIHKNGILRETRYGKDLIARNVVSKVIEYTRRLAEYLDVVGLLAVEYFVTLDGEVLFNEMAPRPHNSYHWTIDACGTSQYKALIQAIFDLPFTPVEPANSATMINLIGEDINKAFMYEAQGYTVHKYNKQERSGRKMGHATKVEYTALPAQCAEASL